MSGLEEGGAALPGSLADELIVDQLDLEGLLGRGDEDAARVRAGGTRGRARTPRGCRPPAPRGSRFLGPGWRDRGRAGWRSAPWRKSGWRPWGRRSRACWTGLCTCPAPRVARAWWTPPGVQSSSRAPTAAWSWCTRWGRSCRSPAPRRCPRPPRSWPGWTPWVGPPCCLSVARASRATAGVDLVSSADCVVPSR